MDWLSGRSYYRGRFAEPTIDNPDQRIQQDIDVFTTGRGHRPQRSVVLLAKHVGLRGGGVSGFGGVLHGDPVEAVGATDGVRVRTSPRHCSGSSSPTC